MDARTSPMQGRPSRNQLKHFENQSCMSTANPEVNVKYSAKSDKTMRETLEKYRQIMNSGEVTKENLYLKKIRFSHPLFRSLSFNAFKMIFDLCEFVQIKKGERLFKQDAEITDLYFVMYGQVHLKFTGNHIVEEGEGGHLGLTLGEEMLFYSQPLYRETAICTTNRACVLQIKTDYLMELGDESFMNRGLNSEAMKKDMELMFERLSHIYNKKERWRVIVA